MDYTGVKITTCSNMQPTIQLVTCVVTQSTRQKRGYNKAFRLLHLHLRISFFGNSGSIFKVVLCCMNDVFINS